MAEVHHQSNGERTERDTQEYETTVAADLCTLTECTVQSGVQFIGLSTLSCLHSDGGDASP